MSRRRPWASRSTTRGLPLRASTGTTLDAALRSPGAHLGRRRSPGGADLSGVGPLPAGHPPRGATWTRRLPLRRDGGLRDDGEAFGATRASAPAPRGHAPRAGGAGRGHHAVQPPAQPGGAQGAPAIAAGTPTVLKRRSAHRSLRSGCWTRWRMRSAARRVQFVTGDPREIGARCSGTLQSSGPLPPAASAVGRRSLPT